MSIASYILALDEQSLSWLGSKKLLRWTYDTLSEVRGIESPICAVRVDLSDRVRSIVPEDTRVISVPANLCQSPSNPGLECYRWLLALPSPTKKALPVSDAAPLVLVALPFSPFLSTAKIEECLVLAKSLLGRYVAPARVMSNYEKANGKQVTQTVASEIGALRIFQRSLLALDLPWAGTFAPVGVNSIEALNMSNPDESRLALALVASDGI